MTNNPQNTAIKAIFASVGLFIILIIPAIVWGESDPENPNQNLYMSPGGFGGFKISDVNSIDYPDYSVNIIGGFAGNSIAPGYVSATIVGGGALKTQTGDDAANRIFGTLGTHMAFSTIVGGYDNQMDSAWPSTIGGGAHNRINMATNDSGRLIKVPNYIPNIATDHSTIGGGSYNSIYNAHYATINGGSQNAIGNLGLTSDNASINGGTRNEVNGINSTIAGGSSNKLTGLQSTIAGGVLNSAGSGNSMFIGGGTSNTINGGFTVIGGGTQNIIGAVNTTFGTYSIIGGGLANTIGTKASSQFGSIIGGRANTINGDYSTVLGGRDNVASSSFNIVAGRQAKTTATGAWALTDSQAADFIVSTPNTLGTRFAGGYTFMGGNVGIGTTSIATTTGAAKLTVVGNTAILGNITSTGILNISGTATSTFNGTVLAKCFSIDGGATCLSNGMSTTTTITNTITNTIIASSTNEFSTVKIQKGIELQDQDTGETYCVVIKSGDWVKTVGSCE